MTVMKCITDGSDWGQLSAYMGACGEVERVEEEEEGRRKRRRRRGGRGGGRGRRRRRRGRSWRRRHEMRWTRRGGWQNDKGDTYQRVDSC